MNVRFPYESVEKGSKVVIYGCGVIGQELFWQMQDSRYCEITGLVDDSFAIDVEPPLYNTEKLKNLSFDVIVIASKNAVAIESMRNSIISAGIDPMKVICECEFEYSRAASVPSPQEFTEKYAFYERIFGLSKESKSDFAGASIYQGFEELGLYGRRDSKERIDAYDIKSLLNKSMNVLDIGCNCGSLDLQIAPYVKSITGVDIDDEMIRISGAIKNYIKNDSVDFMCKNVFESAFNKQFDAVFCFAIHEPVIKNGHVGESEFINTVDEHIKNGGMLFFESHAYRLPDTDKIYVSLSDMLIKLGYKIIMYKHYYGKTSGNINRDITVFLKGA